MSLISACTNIGMAMGHARDMTIAATDLLAAGHTKEYHQMKRWAQDIEFALREAKRDLEDVFGEFEIVQVDDTPDDDDDDDDDGGSKLIEDFLKTL